MKKYISILGIVLAASMSACKKDYLSLEVNPNNPSVTTPQLSLAGNLTLVPNFQVGDYYIYDIWSGYLSWNGGVVPPSSIFQYQFINSDFSPGIWSDWYSNASNFNTLIQTSSKDASLANYQAIAMIMKAYDFEELVDNFNDVPYSQAFQPSTILFPKYDKAADIYTDLANQLDAAVALIDKSSGAQNPGTADVAFGGNMALWKQFANTLHLRLAVRESNLSSNTTKAGLPAAAGSDFLESDAFINPVYQNVATKQNPFYANFGLDANGNPGANAQVYRANAFSVNLLKNTNDPRLTQIFSSAVDPNNQTSTAPFYRGNIFGDAVNILGTKFTSGAGPGLAVSAGQNSIFMLAAESYFLQAEAVERGYITGDASSLYTKGVEASFVYLGLTAKNADDYLTVDANNYAKASSQSDRIKLILTQKYIALLNGYDSFEQFNEYRRTGIPNLPSSVDPAAISSTLPTRLFYPSTERDANPDQYKAAGADKISAFTSKIFWAK